MIFFKLFYSTIIGTIMFFIVKYFFTEADICLTVVEMWIMWVISIIFARVQLNE